VADRNELEVARHFESFGTYEENVGIEGAGLAKRAGGDFRPDASGIAERDGDLGRSGPGRPGIAIV